MRQLLFSGKFAVQEGHDITGRQYFFFLAVPHGGIVTGCMSLIPSF